MHSYAVSKNDMMAIIFRGCAAKDPLSTKKQWPLLYWSIYTVYTLYLQSRYQK